METEKETNDESVHGMVCNFFELQQKRCSKSRLEIYHCFMFFLGESVRNVEANHANRFTVTPLRSQNGTSDISSETVGSREPYHPTLTTDTVDHRRRHMHLQSLERSLTFLVSDDVNSVTEQTIKLRLDQLKENWHSFQDAHLKVIGIVGEHELAKNDRIRAHA